MNKKLRSLLEPNVRMHIVVLLAFIAATAYCRMYILASIEAAVFALLLIYSLFIRRKREKNLASYIESLTYDTENAKNNTLTNFPLPLAVFRLSDSGVVWANDIFFEMAGIRAGRMDAHMTDIIPEFSGKWLLGGNSLYPGLVEIKDRKYQIHGNLIHSEKEGENAFMGITYWLDVTEYEDIRRKFEISRPCVSLIVIDNLEELYHNQPDRIKNDIRDEIEDKLSSWVETHRGIIKRYERDRYVAVFENQYVENMRTEKFDVVPQIHEVKSPLGVEASISIGIGLESDDLIESLQYANSSIELALSRGGDQAVLKNRLSFEFFGGRGGEVEKRTKVRSRVMANTLAEMVKDSSKVYVMGHKMADFDAVGAAVGVCCLARKFAVPARIVIRQGNNAAMPLIERLKKEELYKDAFITPEEAMLKADGRTLMVIVDTNNPNQVESLELMQACNRVAVIDHHRVSADRIENAALAFVEPFSSSASELLTEMLEELTDLTDMQRFESEALMAGMVLDTKSFSLRTGERTFEAAAYLRRAKADTASVKKLMQSDIADTVEKYGILQQAEMYRGIALAAPQEPKGRIVLAKAADELLNISGVDASVAAAPDGQGNVSISARSIGEVNVQILMEKLGGGGNRGAAAAQLKNETIENAAVRIRAAIDDYFTN